MPSAPVPPSGPAPVAAPPPAVAPAPALTGALQRLGQGETLVLGGAALILVVAEGVGRLIANAYGVDTIAWLAALFLIVVIVQRATQRVAALGMPYATVIVILAAVIGAVAVHELLTDLRFFRSPDVVNLLMRLAFYAGAAMVTFGAYVVWRTPALRGRPT